MTQVSGKPPVQSCAAPAEMANPSGDVETLDAYDFSLPPELVAQEPPPERNGGRLLRLDRRAGTMSHQLVSELPELLDGNELIVLNDTRVVPARLFATKRTGGRVELLTLPPAPQCPADERFCMVRTAGKLRAGDILTLQQSPAPSASVTVEAASPRDGFAAETCGNEVRVIEAQPGRARVRFATAAYHVLGVWGHVPLPPYIHRHPGTSSEVDRTRYQTVYAHPNKANSVAAPTAGLHFTPAMLERAQERGARVARVTLHVGPGTFLPVRVADLRNHAVEPEWCEVTEEALALIHEAKARGNRTIAVGTTSVRTLEGCWARPEGARPGQWQNDLTVRPGHHFKVVDSLLTNFHLPRSSLLVLVATFAGHQQVMRAYEEAVRERYRFYSYGDAMWIV